MKLRFLPAVLGLLFCLPETVFCQITTAPGYIISASGDTMRGQLEYVNTNLSTTRTFIPDATGKLEFLKPDQLHSFYVNEDIHFRKSRIKNRVALIQVISEGQVNLYRYKGELYLKTPTDSLIMLTGGKKTVEQNGKKYALYDYSYKSQLRKLLPTDAFNQKLERLQFDKEQICQLVQVINQKPIIKKQVRLSKKYQFGGQFGVARNSFNVLKSNYSENNLHSIESFESTTYSEKVKINSLAAGINFRRKAGRKYAYLQAGLLFEKALKESETEKKYLYTSYFLSDNTIEPYGLTGYMTDTYSYNFAAISIPLSYYGELSDGRLRPFLDLGLNTRIYTNRDFTLNRKVYVENALVSEENSKLYIKPFTVGPTMSAGCRYLFRNNTSIAAGLHFDAVLSKNIVDPNDLKTNATMLYVSYCF